MPIPRCVQPGIEHLPAQLETSNAVVPSFSLLTIWPIEPQINNKCCQQAIVLTLLAIIELLTIYTIFSTIIVNSQRMQFFFLFSFSDLSHRHLAQIQSFCHESALPPDDTSRIVPAYQHARDAYSFANLVEDLLMRYPAIGGLWLQFKNQLFYFIAVILVLNFILLQIQLQSLALTAHLHTVSIIL